MDSLFDRDNWPSLSPANFFQIGFDCHYYKSKDKLAVQKYLLPSTSPLCAETSFASLHMGWHEEGLHIHVKSNQPFLQSFYPEVSRGDSVELFFDTRDVKTSGYNTKFCHHFFFLPESIEGNQCGEITRFRTEDRHDLCDPSDLFVKTTLAKDSYQMQIFIPAQCLNGYDPEQFGRLGFTYRINRRDGSPQHFSVSTEDFQIEQQPSLWSHVKLVK